MAVHRYKANESPDNDEKVEKKVAPVKKVAKTASKQVTNTKEVVAKKPIKVLAPFRAIKDYFVGSWRELRLVRWPNRKQTWAMTLAVMLFSLALGVLIFLLDAGFTLLFKKFVF